MTPRALSTSLVTLGALLAAAPATRSAPGRRPASSRPPVLVALMHPQSVWVVGAHDAKRGWLNDERARSLFKTGTRFSVLDERGGARTVTIGKVEAADGVGGYVATTRMRVAGTPRAAVAGVSRPVPRAPRVQSLDHPLYREAAGALLTAKGLSVPRARLTQHLRVDLNGDGVDEVLLCAQSRPGIGHELNVQKGDYSLAALRFVVGGKVKTVPLGIEGYPQASRDGSLASLGFQFLCPCDIDGDGRMEIVLYSRQFEMDNVEVFAFDGKTTRRVLAAGWGV